MNFKCLTSKALHKNRIFLAFSVIFLCLSLTSFAYAGTGIYITTNTYVTQNPYDNLCWAAASVSMVQTKGHFTSVKTYVEDARGSFEDTCSTTYWVNSYFHEVYGISTTRTGTIGFSTIKSNMMSNNPIYARIQWRSGGSHAVVISGTDSSVNSLRIMDPYYGWEYPSYNTFYSDYLSDGDWKESIKFN